MCRQFQTFVHLTIVRWFTCSAVIYKNCLFTRFLGVGGIQAMYKRDGSLTNNHSLIWRSSPFYAYRAVQMEWSTKQNYTLNRADAPIPRRPIGKFRDVGRIQTQNINEHNTFNKIHFRNKTYLSQARSVLSNNLACRGCRHRQQATVAKKKKQHRSSFLDRALPSATCIGTQRWKHPSGPTL